jgi:trans-2,3-dihydro-3-hydroxyanthranilate isomerase
LRFEDARRHTYDPSMVDYHLLDVFTTERFAGNPLAVCVDQEVAEPAAMQRVARELNLSETVFVSTASYPYPTRIFTPNSELAFAGHPTIGTAVLVASLGHAKNGAVVLAEGVGDIHVTVTDATAEFCTVRLPEQVGAPTRADGAAAVGVGVEDLHPDLDPAIWDSGLAWPIVAVRDVATLGRTRFVPGALDNVYVVAPETGVPGNRWRARSFALGYGIAEDPATGSAVAAFAGYVGRLAHDKFVVTQGVEMGRPSELRLAVTRDGATITEVRVAGEAVVVGRGSLFL